MYNYLGFFMLGENLLLKDPTILFTVGNTEPTDYLLLNKVMSGVWVASQYADSMLRVAHVDTKQTMGDPADFIAENACDVHVAPWSVTVNSRCIGVFDMLKYFPQETAVKGIVPAQGRRILQFGVLYAIENGGCPSYLYSDRTTGKLVGLEVLLPQKK